MKESLQERINKSMGSARVSMVPEPREPRQKKVKEVEVAVDLQEVTDKPLVRAKILKLSKEIYELGLIERDAKVSKEPLVKALKRLLTEEGIDAERFMADELQILSYEIPRSTISVELLMEKGVLPHIIKACTVTNKSSALKISLPGEKDE